MLRLALAGCGLVPDSKVHGPTWGPSGSCRPQMGPMLAPWTLLSGVMTYGATDHVQHWLTQSLVMHQAISSTNVDFSLKVFCGIYPTAILQVPMNLIRNTCYNFKIATTSSSGQFVNDRSVICRPFWMTSQTWFEITGNNRNLCYLQSALCLLMAWHCCPQDENVS